MPNIHTTLSSLFSDIADAIRAKTGGSAQIVADNFPTAIANIPTGVDTSDATAGEGDILSGETAYLSDGRKHAGSMPNNGAVSQTLDTTTTSYAIPQGYHNGNGGVSVTPQTKSATPSGSSQTVSADSGKVLSSVSVGAVTKNSGIGQTLYNEGVNDTKVGTAVASHVLYPDTFTNASGVGNVGSMPNRGAWTSSVTPSASSQRVTIPEGYHNGNGYVDVGASSGGVSQASLIVDEHIDYLQSITPTLENGKSYFIIFPVRLSLSAQGSLAFIVGTSSIGSTGIYKMQGTTNPTFQASGSGGANLKIYELS